MPPEPRPSVISRRNLMTGFAAGLTLWSLPARGAGRPTRIVSLDYGLSSTLLSLGVVPTAISDLADWGRWVREPEMPASVIDLGSSWEVNAELLTELKPDLILTTPYLDELLEKLKSIGPVLRLQIYDAGIGDILPAAIKGTRNLGAAIGRGAEAERFLSNAEAKFNDCRRRLADRSPPPLALINLMDARHCRIYGRPGLFHNVLDRIGVANAWPNETNYWGFETIAIEDLSKISDPRTRLIAFEPIPGDILPKLAESPLWQALPFTRPERFSTLPPALMFGMVNEALRFAGLVTDLLETSNG